MHKPLAGLWLFVAALVGLVYTIVFRIARHIALSDYAASEPVHVPPHTP